MFKENPAGSASRLNFGRGLLLFILAQSYLISNALAAASVPTFGGNAQHTANFSAPAQTLNVVRWQTSIDTSGLGGLVHYGAPLATAANTIIVPVRIAGGSFQVGLSTGALERPSATSRHRLPATNL